MPTATGILIIVTALVTAFISGVFGMAGGLIFMGVIAVFLGVAEAMVVHGAVQSVSNGFRARLLKVDIRWDVLRFVAMGAVPAVILLAFIRFIPSKPLLYLALGLLPFLLWLPKGWLAFDAQKPAHAVLCGFSVMILNLTAGVAGPALDFFFVKTALTRQEIVATKALIMLVSHMAKIIYFGVPLIMAAGLTGLPPWWVFALAVPAVMLGTYGGTRVLKRFSDTGFRSATRYLVTVIGVVYIWRAFALYGWV